MPDLRETLAALKGAEALLQTEGPLPALAAFNTATDIYRELRSRGHFHTYVLYCARTERWVPQVNRILGRILARSLESFETADAEVKLAYRSAFHETCERIECLDYCCWEYENLQLLDSEGKNLWTEVGCRLKGSTDDFYLDIRKFARARFPNLKISAIHLEVDAPDKLAKALDGELIHYIRAHRDDNLAWIPPFLGRYLSANDERKIVELLEDDVVCQVLVHNGLLEACHAELRLQYDGGRLITYTGIRSILYATRALAFANGRASNGGPSILDRFKSTCFFVVQEAIDSLDRYNTQYIGMSTTRKDNHRNVWHLLCVLAAFPSLRQALITSGIVSRLVRLFSNTIASYVYELENGPPHGHHILQRTPVGTWSCALVIIWFLHLDFDENAIQILLDSFAQLFSSSNDKEPGLTIIDEKGFSKSSRMEKWITPLKLIWSLLVDLQRVKASVLRDWPERIIRHLIDTDNVRVVFFMIAHIPDQNDELLIRWWSTFFDNIETWLYADSATKDEPRGSLARILARCNLNQQNPDTFCTILNTFIHNQNPRSFSHRVGRNRLPEFQPFFFDSRLDLVSLGGIEIILESSLLFSEVALALIHAGHPLTSVTWTEWMQTTLDASDGSDIENERLLQTIHLVLKNCNPPIAFASLKMFPGTQGRSATNGSADPESSNYVRAYLNMIACLTIVIYACRRSLPGEAFRLLAAHLHGI